MHELRSGQARNLALGAHEVVVSQNTQEMARQASSFDLILDTVAASHDLDAFTTLLKVDGTLTLVCVPDHPHPSPDILPPFIRRRRNTGSAISGIAETQELLDFWSSIASSPMLSRSRWRRSRPPSAARRRRCRSWTSYLST